MDSRKIKKLILNNLAYVIFGYAGNIICFAFRTAEGKAISEKILPALNNLGTAFAHIVLKLSITLDTFPTRIMKRSGQRQSLCRIFAALQQEEAHQWTSRSCGCSSNS